MLIRFAFLLIILLIVFNLYANSSIYDYGEEEELIEKIEYEHESNNFEDWLDSKVLLRFAGDLVGTYEDRYYLQANSNNLSLSIYKRENEKPRLFARYIKDKYLLGFGSFRPTYALGNIYKADSENFKNRVLSTSQFDFYGLFFTYKYNFLKLDIYYSNSELNTKDNLDGTKEVVYYESSKSSLEQTGLISSYQNDNIKASVLYSLFKTSDRLEQFSNSKSSSLLSFYLRYRYAFINLEYENNYQFSRMCHTIKVNYTDENYKFNCLYKSLPNRSLAWFNTGITNKFNANTELLSGKCQFPLFNTTCLLASEMRFNSKLNDWRSRNSLKIAKIRGLASYKVSQDLYKDYKGQKLKKYTHRLSTDMIRFINSKLSLNYVVNNKKESGLAHKYEVMYYLDCNNARYQFCLTVLDNYKNEEVFEDIEQNIITTFYNYSEDVIFSFIIKTEEYKNLVLKANILHSLYNNNLNSLRIELSYLL